jgi:hypothetical protein
VPLLMFRVAFVMGLQPGGLMAQICAVIDCTCVHGLTLLVALSCEPWVTATGAVTFKLFFCCCAYWIEPSPAGGTGQRTPGRSARSVSGSHPHGGLQHGCLRTNVLDMQQRFACTRHQSCMAAAAGNDRRVTVFETNDGQLCSRSQSQHVPTASHCFFMTTLGTLSTCTNHGLHASSNYCSCQDDEDVSVA